MDVVQFKCPNCGGSVVFDPKTQKHICEFCMSDFTEEEYNHIRSMDNSDGDTYTVPSGEEQKEFNDHTNLYICDSCGAEIIADENTAATFCYYCHNPVALKGRLTGECRPELIIPFKYTKEQTIDIYKKWCGKKWFLPKDFTSFSQLEKITGLYVPFWLADCSVNAEMHAEGRIIDSFRSGDYQVTHTKIYSVERGASLEYRGVPADGSKKLDDKLMDSIEPFNYSEFVPFSMSYLSGFFADKYDVSKAEVLPRIQRRIESGAQDILMSDVKGYTTVVPDTKRTRIIRTKWHYTMLPVWFMTYKYGGKNYYFAMNGQTGKVVGIPPISIPKLIGLAVGLFAAIGIIAGFIGGAI